MTMILLKLITKKKYNEQYYYWKEWCLLHISTDDQIIWGQFNKNNAENIEKRTKFHKRSYTSMVPM